MIYVKYALMVPVMLLLMAAAYPLAFILPLFVSDRAGFLDNATKYGIGKRLPVWLAWFQTPDNDLTGDEGWRTEHWQWRYKLPNWLAEYVGMVGWLWRNPAYGFGAVTMTGNPIVAAYDGDDQVNDSPLHEGSIKVYSQGLFQYAWVKKITATKCLYFNFGWNIKGLIHGREYRHIAAFAFSPRLSKFN